MDGRPTRIAIDHDDYHAEYVGVTQDGRQFILTTPFDSAHDGHPGGEFLALYLFDEAGVLIEAKIDSFGPRSNLDHDARRSLADQRLASLGDVSFQRVEIAPFKVEHLGIDFGLIVREPEDEGDVWAVIMLPGDYMAFFEPWDSGEYDT